MNVLKLKTENRECTAIVIIILSHNNLVSYYNKTRYNRYISHSVVGDGSLPNRWRKTDLKTLSGHRYSVEYFL